MRTKTRYKETYTNKICKFCTNCDKCNKDLFSVLEIENNVSMICSKYKYIHMEDDIIF